MMHCPYCHNEVTRVQRTGLQESGFRRIRECTKCGKKFETVESYAGFAKMLTSPKIKRSL